MLLFWVAGRGASGGGSGGVWILASGFWVDSNQWVDTANWVD